MTAQHGQAVTMPFYFSASSDACDRDECDATKHGESKITKNPKKIDTSNIRGLRSASRAAHGPQANRNHTPPRPPHARVPRYSMSGQMLAKRISCRASLEPQKIMLSRQGTQHEVPPVRRQGALQCMLLPLAAIAYLFTCLTGTHSRDRFKGDSACPVPPKHLLKAPTWNRSCAKTASFRPPPTSPPKLTSARSRTTRPCTAAA